MKAPAVATPVLWPARYGLLDGIRGIAALVVVLNHLDAVSSAAGHAAVMVFFVISGYCITASADSFRRNARGFSEFMLRRLKRIYPPYLLALLFFAATRVVKTAMGAPNSLHHTGIEWLQNLTLTQWLSDLVHPVAEPVQNATLFVVAFWSLNYEEQFYLVMAVAGLLATRRRLPLIASVVFMGILGPGLELDHSRRLDLRFVSRVLGAFRAGSLLVFCAHSIRRSAAPPRILMADGHDRGCKRH